MCVRLGVCWDDQEREGIGVSVSNINPFFKITEAWKNHFRITLKNFERGSASNSNLFSN